MNRCSRTRRETASTLVILAIFLVALFGFAGLSIDVGNVLLQRKKANEGTDAAALAAVVDWATGSTPAQVDTMGRSYCTANGVTSNEVLAVQAGKWVDATKTFTVVGTLKSTDVPAVRVTARRTVNMAFAQVVGMTQMTPAVESIAVVGNAQAACCILPWAGCSLSTPPNKCDTVTLKNGNDCSGPGNFGALNLNPGGGHGGGAKNYEDNIANGYQYTVHVGDQFYTEPGNMVGPTSKGINDRIGGLPAYNCTATSAPPQNARFILVPVTSSLGNGSSQVTILGFWTMVLNDANGGNVTAQFVTSFSGSEVDPTSPPVTGMLNGAALVK